MTKYLIFDSGPIISLTMSGIVSVLEKLKENFDGEFIITPQVRKEIIDSPMKIKKFELEALQVQNLVDKKILKNSDEFVNFNRLEKETKEIIRIASEVLRVSSTGEHINIIHDGEASCLAFAELCDGDSLIVSDERTIRLLSEKPENLEELMEHKLHTPLEAKLSLVKKFKDFKFIRSAELLFVAYEKNLFPFKKDRQLLDALLYAVKFNGTAISSDEIEQMKKLAN